MNPISDKPFWGDNSKDFMCFWNKLDPKEKKELLFHLLEGHLSIKLKELAVSGENLVDCDEDGSNLLHHAALSDDLEAVECLLYMGCDVNKKDKWGRTPLHIASASGNLKVLKKLLLHNKKWFERDNNKKTFLHLANPNLKTRIYFYSFWIFIKRVIFFFK